MLNLFLPIVSKVVDSVVSAIPDERQQARTKAKLEGELVAAANAALRAQLEINKTEAAHRAIFVAGWRPFIGWICGLGIFWAFIGQPLAAWLATLVGAEVMPPSLASDRLFELVLAMIGISGLRTFEKLKGVARER